MANVNKIMLLKK